MAVIRETRSHLSPAMSDECATSNRYGGRSRAAIQASAR